jgi:putative membrane protein
MISKILIVAVALLHLYFLVLEMFLWTKPKGLKTFRMDQKRANDTAVLAANQGLYNGFLSAGLLWSVLHPNPIFSFQLGVFFLSCVLVAALYGGYSVGKSILIIQGIPALIAITTLCLSFFHA